MAENDKKNDIMFSHLVISLQMGAMQQMGKVASPITGKIERDIEMAKASIDMLSMLEVKTKGNLSEEESKLLGHVLYELRMNYVDESKKGDDKTESPEVDEKMTESEEKTDEKDKEKDEEKPAE